MGPLGLTWEDEMTRERFLEACQNHNKVMRLLLVRAYMRSGLTYPATCLRLLREHRQLSTLAHPDDDRLSSHTPQGGLK
jgi:hypothetical protein